MYCVIALALFLPAILAQGGVSGQLGGQGGLNVPRQQFGGPQQFGGQFGAGYGQYSPYGQGVYGQGGYGQGGYNQPCRQYGGGQYGGYPGQYGQQGGQFGGQSGGQRFFDENDVATSAAPAADEANAV